MNRTMLVMRNEIATTIRKPSFLLVFLIPMVAVAMFGALSIVESSAEATGSAGSAQAGRSWVEGYVDTGGTVHALPPNVPSGRLVAFADEASASKALREGSISAYFVVPANYLETGKLIYVPSEYKPLSSEADTSVMEWTLLFNILGGDARLAGRVWDPGQVTVRRLVPEPASNAAENCLVPGKACQSNLFVRFMPEMTMILFFVLLTMSSSFMVNSITDEKKNRVLEILMSSISAREMLAGKIVGLGLIGLLQALVWIGVVYFGLRRGGAGLGLPAGFSFPLGILAWALVYFLLGYAIYASLMAGVGALAPSAKESGATTMLVTSPLLLGYFASLVVDDVNGLAPTIASLFPLTTPVAMVKRMVSGPVPLWQMLLAAALMLVSAFLTVWAVARMFRAQLLLSGQPASPRRYLRALLREA